jgi:SAM-dependent methyltransferase
MSEPLEFDGERFTPESVREIWYEHMHRYAFAGQFVRGKTVLDAACGEGYGSALLSRYANAVTGVDLSERAIEHARQRYPLGNLEFHQGDCCRLSYEDQSFDCIVSFETIEHLEDQRKMLAEFERVLKPSGFLLISSPDKSVYSDEREFKNPHHVRELYADEFRDLLSGRFPVIRMFGQKLLFHSAIWPLESRSPGDPGGRPSVHLQSQDGDGLRETTEPVQKAMYLLAFCGSREDALPAVENAVRLFDDAEETVYRHYQHEIRKNMAAGAILAERDQALSEARAELDTCKIARPPRRSWLSRLGFSRRRD